MDSPDNTAASAASTDVELTSLIQDSSDPSQEEDALPPLASYVPVWKFWLRVFEYPTLFAVCNGVVIGSLIVADEEMYDWSSSWRKRMAYTAVRSLAATLVLLLGDAFALYYGQARVQKDLDALAAEEEQQRDGEENMLSHTFARLSRKVDAFLTSNANVGGVRATSQARPLNFLLHFLWALFGLCAILSIVVAVTLLQLLLMGDALSDCWVHGDPHQVTNTSFVPPNVLEWFKDSYYGGGNANYIHTTTGFTFFQASDEMQPYGKLVSVGPDGTLTEHFGVMQPRSFILSDDNRTFCCIYSPAEQEDHAGVARISRGPRDFVRPQEGVTAVLCQQDSSSSDLSLINATIPKPLQHKENKRIHLTDASLKLSENVPWLLSRWYRSHNSPYMSESREITILYRVDSLSSPAHLNLTQVATSGDGIGGDAEAKTISCFRRFTWVGVLVGILASVGVGAWIYFRKSSPSAVVGPSLSLYSLLFAIDQDFAFYSGFVGTIVVSSCFVKQPHREIKLWALYSILFALLLAGILDEEGRGDDFHVVLASFLAVYVGIILDHPLLQVFGWLGAVVAVCVLVLYALLALDVEVVFVIPVCIIVSSGLISVGYTLTKYRAYAVYYSRRLWMAVVATDRNNHQQRRGLLSRTNN